LAADVPQMEQAVTAMTVRLLPNFDPYTFTANRGVAAILPDKHKAQVYRVAGWISPVLLVNGAIAGVWQYTKQRDRVSVKVEPFTHLSAEVKALVAAEAERLGHFFDSPTELTYGRVNYGKSEAGDERAI
jgi:winged helix DNA-binding protein